MEKSFEDARKCDKDSVFQREVEKLTALFSSVEDSKRQLVEGLIKDAAFLAAENAALRMQLGRTGMVRISPANPTRQRPVEAARQYRQNVNSYAVIIKTLSGILDKGGIEEEDDEMGEYE